MAKMFWGLILEPGKKYEQKAESSFHLTMACLEPSNKTPTPNKSSITSVILESNKTPFILCNLDQQRVLQQPLDCVFTEGEPISFSVNGDSKVHLSGYIMPDSDMEDSDDMFDLDGSESDSEAELMAMNEKKRKMNESKEGNKKVKFGDEPVAAAKNDKKQEKAKPQAKGAKNDAQAKGGAKPKFPFGEDDDDEDDDDEDDSMGSEDMANLLDNFEDDEDDEDEDDDEDDSSPEVKKIAKPQQGKQQNQKPTPAKQGGGGQPGVKPDGQKNQTPQGKKPFQQGGQGGGGKPWSGGKGKGGPPHNHANKNQNSGKKGTPKNDRRMPGGSPGSGAKKPWAQKK